MLELPLLFMSGLLGSAHCLGMCGPFAIAIGANIPTWRENLARQLSYTLGRVFTYAFLGACAAFGGAALARQGASWVRVPAVLAIVAGAAMILQGLASAHVFHWLGFRSETAQRAACLAASFFAPFLRKPGTKGVFLAGLLTGFLPCGLVYAMLALAASSTNLWQGMLTMIVFGMGTAPAMMMTGWSGSLVPFSWRQRALHVAAWCLVVAGTVSVARGAGYLPLTAQPPAGCPFCAARETQATQTSPATRTP